MATLQEQLTQAQADFPRLQGIETQYNALMAQIPGGDLPAFIAEYNRRGTEVTRLQGIETQWNAVASQVPKGDVSAFMAEHTRLSGEVSRLTADLETARAATQTRGETLAAEIVASTGSQAPAAAETTTVAATAEPKSAAEFAETHARLTAESSSKGSAYYRQFGKKFGF